MSTPELLFRAGFLIGPEPWEDCERCPHPWGKHTLFAPGNPLEGGTYWCPTELCECRGTWDVTHGRQ